MNLSHGTPCIQVLALRKCIPFLRCLKFGISYIKSCNVLTKFHWMFVLLTYHEESVCRVWKRCQTLGTRKSAECEGLIYDSLPNVQCPNRPQREVPSQLISCWYLLFDLKHLYSTLSSSLSIWFYLQKRVLHNRYGNMVIWQIN